MKKFVLMALLLAAFYSCGEKCPGDECTEGRVVGYLKCVDCSSTDSLLFGLFLLTGNSDSLLSFDFPTGLIMVDTAGLGIGADFLDGGESTFSYRLADSSETRCFSCPPALMNVPTFPTHGFIQVVITSIAE
ncbi:MAG: hypothetical protein ACOYXB_13675 [Bacteroidota bacterium]